MEIQAGKTILDWMGTGIGLHLDTLRFLDFSPISPGGERDTSHQYWIIRYVKQGQAFSFHFHFLFSTMYHAS